MKRLLFVVALVASLWGSLAVGCRAQAPASLRDEFRKLVQTDRAPVALNPRPISDTAVGDSRVEKVRIATELGEEAVVLIHRPKAEGRYPTVVFQHFLGGSKDYPALTLLYGALVQRGFLVAAIDGRYRGERQNGVSLDAAMLQALRTGKGRPFLIDTAYDLTRLLDYLQTRPDVDSARIGMSGFSEGGILTWMTAVADDRIRVAVPIIGVTAFGETLRMQTGPDVEARVRLFTPLLTEYAKDLGEPGPNARVLREAWSKLVPGMLDRFDAPNLLPHVAPRPMLVMSHEKDELFPVIGAQKAVDAAKVRYLELSAADRLDFRIAPGLGHAPTNTLQLLGEMTGMVTWMERWLKTATVPAT